MWDEGEDEDENGLDRDDQRALRDADDAEKERLKKIYWYDYQYDYFLRPEDWNADCTGTLRGTITSVFPTKGCKIKFDEYGETIQPEEFSSLSIRDEQTVSNATSVSLKKDNTKNKQKTISAPEELIPSKWVSTSVELKISCRITFIDFEGLSDGRSIKTIISRISPRKLVLVSGNPTTSQYMLQFCKLSEEITDNVSIAKPQETSSISSSLDVFTVKIDEELLSTLEVKSFGSYELAYLVGSVKEENETRTLVSVAEANLLQHNPILVGNPKLSLLKKLLVQRGYPVSLLGGQLVCGDQIKVQKSASHPGTLSIEGPLCEEYYVVRDLLYSQLAVL